MTKKQLATIRGKIKRLLGVRPSVMIPILFEEGDNEPELHGQSGGYFTKSGNRVKHPGAYAKKGWSNLVYHKSSRSITVGDGWVESNLDSLLGLDKVS